MVRYDIGRLPVLQDDMLLGIVTRTDILRQIHQLKSPRHLPVADEFSASIQLNPNYDLSSEYDFAYNLGYQRHIADDFSIGVHWFFNLSIDGMNSPFHMGLRPRIAYKLSRDFEASFSPGLIVTSSRNDIEQFKGLSFETNLSWRNKVGMVFRVDRYNLMMQEKDTSVTLGIQTHGSTSLYSSSGLFLGGGLFLILIAAFGII